MSIVVTTFILIVALAVFYQYTDDEPEESTGQRSLADNPMLVGLDDEAQDEASRRHQRDQLLDLLESSPGTSIGRTARRRLLAEHGWSLLVDVDIDGALRNDASTHAWGDPNKPEGRELEDALMRILKTPPRASRLDPKRIYQNLRNTGFSPSDRWLSYLVARAQPALRQIILRDVVDRDAPEAWVRTFTALHDAGLDVDEQMERIRDHANAGGISLVESRDRGALTTAEEVGGLEMHHERDA